MTLLKSRYSQYLNPKVLDSYTQLLGDDEYLSQRQEMALLSARIEELLQKLPDDFVSGRFISESNAALKDAIATGDPGNIQKAAQALSDAVDRNESERKVWIEVRECIQERGNLAKIDMQRLKLADQYVNKEQIAFLFAALARSIKQNLAPADAQLIYQELRRLTGVGFDGDEDFDATA